MYHKVLLTNIQEFVVSVVLNILLKLDVGFVAAPSPLPHATVSQCMARCGGVEREVMARVSHRNTGLSLASCQSSITAWKPCFSW